MHISPTLYHSTVLIMYELCIYYLNVLLKITGCQLSFLAHKSPDCLVCSICAVQPPVAVVNKPQVVVTSTSVMVSWSPADNPVNGTVTGYQLTVVILGASDNTTHFVLIVDGASTTNATLTSLGM